MASGSGQMASPMGAEQVRKKWDALLSVINNVSVDNDAAAAADSAQDSVQAARELLQHSASLKMSRSSPLRPKQRKDWDSRHHLLYSKVNGKMQKNVRAYFDRPREAEGYGLKHREALRTVWQLDTTEVPPKPGEAHPNAIGKTWQIGGRCYGGGARSDATRVTEGIGLIVGGNVKKRYDVLDNMIGGVAQTGSFPTPTTKEKFPPMSVPSVNREDYEEHIDGGGWFLHKKSGNWKYNPEIGIFQNVKSGCYYVNKGGVMQKVDESFDTHVSPDLRKSTSLPHFLKELDWDNRHHLMFNKDNHHYHPNFREYFERPRRLLY